MYAYQVSFYVCLIFPLLWTLASAITPVRQCECQHVEGYPWITNEMPISSGADDSNPLPLMVQIDTCDELPCDLLKGVDSDIAIQFVATRNSMRQLTARVHLTSLGVTIPYELEAQRSDVCSNLLHGAYCPLDSGEDVTYRLLLAVPSTQLEVPTRLQVTLHDAERGDQVVACFLADTRVKKPSS
ncbi:hypothetical protein KR222_010907 [Zaprionus bogoriensis]|nr:hypothetical protein KR222_010907 [Zaprionus bogoriensis]